MKNSVILIAILITIFLSHTRANIPVLSSGIENNTITLNDKKTIAIWPFEGNNTFGAIDGLHSIVTDAVAKTDRFRLVERSRLNAIIKELDIQMGYEAVNSDVLVEQGKALGANYYLFGNINSVGTKRKNRKNSISGEMETTFSCSISLNLRIVDVETGTIKETETITVGEGQELFSFLSANSEQEAWNKACKKILSETNNFIKKSFPLTISIIQIEKEKKGKAYDVLIAGGTKIGLKKKDKICVFEISEMEVDGEIFNREKEIATLTVSKVEGNKISLCRVKKGGGELKDKIESGAKLICKTQ